MASLAVHAPLRALAEVLYAATTLGHDAWNHESRSDGKDRIAQGGEPELSRDLLALFQLLHERQASYLLVGGVALLKYVDGRNTQDIDLVLSPQALNSLPEIVVSHSDRDVARGNFRSLRVDVLLTVDPVFRLAHEKYATVHSFHEVTVRCATVEGLALLKLYALPSLYRQGDAQRIAMYEADIMMLLDRHHPEVEPLYQALEPFVEAGALVELRRIVDEMHNRIAQLDQVRKKS